MAVAMKDIIPTLSTVYSISTRALQRNITPFNDVTSIAGMSYSLSETITENINGSTDYTSYLENIPYPRELKKFPLWEIIVKTLFYVIVIVLATAGNCLVIAVVYTNTRMQTTTNFYIVNLAASDLLVTLSCSWVHLVSSLNEDWVLGAFFCKFNSFAQVTSTVSSILTLTVIACDRFFGIVFALKAHIAERRAWYAIVLLWIIAIVVAAPLLYVRRLFMTKWANHTERFCTDDWTLVTNSMNAMKARRIYYTFVSIVLFFVPVLVMSLAYAMIIWKLWSAQIPGERLETENRNQLRVKRKIVLMLMMILAAFVICWLPYQISILYSEYRSAGVATPV
ncbi:QRFP-like peptide receptor [Octopus bimaculoides]|uniref:QRFP-like peptide receptor n=1 Tax=Octopus bimaculoides TaxID=37653 RepID=UPI0022E5DB52|nr:QRFP-like peptide receptor [Octopus bimaculoides]XP_052829132.1 QRFP-like peptide receptor [Octopus bimaculoides]